MAALTITPSAIIKGTGANVSTGIAGASITAGQALYKDSAASDVLKLADANASSATAACVGISLHAALTGQPLQYQDGGVLAFGAILTVGEIYVLGATAGEINPVGDLATGWKTTILGIASSTSNLTMRLYASDITHS